MTRAGFHENIHFLKPGLLQICWIISKSHFPPQRLVEEEKQGEKEREIRFSFSLLHGQKKSSSERNSQSNAVLLSGFLMLTVMKLHSQRSTFSFTILQLVTNDKKLHFNVFRKVPRARQYLSEASGDFLQWNCIPKDQYFHSQSFPERKMWRPSHCRNATNNWLQVMKSYIWMCFIIEIEHAWHTHAQCLCWPVRLTLNGGKSMSES